MYEPIAVAPLAYKGVLRRCWAAGAYLATML